MEQLKIFELFAGIGAPRKALDNLGIEYESLGFSEIDKHAIKSYCAIHNDVPENNYGDIKCIKAIPINIDILFHGSPCTTFSIAGLRTGGDKGSGTPSSLMWETVRLIEQSKPKVVIWENVKNVLSETHIHNFNAYIDNLTELGYRSHTKVLVATDFGIPQNRERVFVVSIRNDVDYKFDFENLETKKMKPLNEFIDFVSYDQYNFSIKENTKTGYVDLVTPTVLDTSYLTSKTRRGRHQMKNDKVISPTITTKPNINIVEWYDYDDLTDEQKKKVNLQMKRKELTDNNEITSIIDIDRSLKFLKNLDPIHSNGVANTLTARKAIYLYDEHNFKIRAITARECYRLMGFSDEDYKKAINVSTENQLIKQAGNSIVVDIIEAIYKELFFNQGENRKGQMTLF